MTYTVPYINGAMTLAENVFNFLGYLPADRFSKINEKATTWRSRLGALQMITGMALSVLGVVIESMTQKAEPQKYLTFAEQMSSLGILVLNHGVLNIGRSYAEQKGFGPLLAAYDFYGRKILPALAASFDLQGWLFEKIRRQLDKIHSIVIFPYPNISLRT